MTSLYNLILVPKVKTLHCATLDAVEPWGNAVFKSTAKEWMSSRYAGAPFRILTSNLPN